MNALAVLVFLLITIGYVVANGARITGSVGGDVVVIMFFLTIFYYLMECVVEPYFRKRRERRSPEKIIEDQRKLDEFLGGSRDHML